MDKIKELENIYNEYKKEKLSDGEALDSILDVLEELNPALKRTIIDIDGDELTDGEAIDIVKSVYHLGE